MTTADVIVAKERSTKNAAIEWLGRLRPVRLVALLALLTLVPLVVLALLALRFATDAVRQEVKAKLAASAEVSAALLSKEIDHLSAFVESYARRPSLGRALAAGRTHSAAVRSPLAELEARREIAAALLSDPRGTILATRPQARDLVGGDFSFRDWYRGVTRTGATYVSSAYTSATPGHPEVVAAAVPVFARGANTGDEPVAILVAAYELQRLQTFAERLARSQGLDLTVTDQKGALLASPGASPSQILTRDNGPGVSQALAGRSGVIEQEGPEGAVLSAYAPVAGSGWTITADVPAATALAQLSTLRAAVLPITCVLGIVLAAGLGMLYLALREQRRTQSALAAREAEMTAVIEAAEDAFVSMDADGFITGWNRRAEEVFGWERDEALGRCLGETIVPPAYRKAHRHGLTRLLETGESDLLNKRIEVEALHRDGHLFPVELAIWRVDVDGQPRFNAFVHDITERRELEGKRSHLAAIIESSDDAIIGFDLEGSILSWNRGAEKLYGYAASEAVGESMSLLTPPERDSAMKTYLDQARRNNGVERCETERLTKDGRRIPVALTISPIKDGEGKVMAASEIGRDITARVQAEEEMTRARVEALEASRMKSEFLANMSHEIRTPMNGIIGSTDLLLGTDLSSEQREFVHTIQASGDALLTLINDILDFSKIEAGKIELEDTTFDLRVAVDDSVELLAARAHEKGLEIATLIEPNVPATVRGDPGRLRQVLVNLVSNAVKFTERGEVVVRVSMEDESEQGCRVRFCITDTGVGIEPSHRERLFDSFTQADASTTRRYGGTGLGLAISKQLVELMGGEIGVESEVGVGSTFWFTLAMRRGAETEAAVLDEEATLEGLRVLVVDDHATNRAMLELNVANWGMQSMSASNGRQALAMLRAAVGSKTPFAIALLDFNMPEMDGIELARTIHQDASLGDLRLVLLTSSGERVQVSSAQEAGIDAYLTKPVRHASLHDTLLTIVGSSAPGPSAAMITGYSLSEARARLRPHILVVEDNVVNQKVAAKMLDKLGYRVDIASDGAEAVEAVQSGDYAAVLMDCQMPGVDGYEATRRIRRLEGAAARVLIIAMTAGAMQQDRDRASAAGMDDFLPKPVKVEALDGVLQRRTKEDGGEEAAAPPPERPAAGAAVDRGVLRALHELDGATEHDSSLVSQFLASAETSLEKLHQAVARGDGKEIAFLAHSLKGIVGTLGARKMAEKCAQLDELATKGDLESVPMLAAEIAHEFDRMCVEIQAGAPESAETPTPK